MNGRADAEQGRLELGSVDGDTLLVRVAMQQRRRPLDLHRDLHVGECVALLPN